MSDADRSPAPSPAADAEPSTEEGVRRWGLDLEVIGIAAAADIAAGRVYAHDEVMARAREHIAARRRAAEPPPPAAPPIRRRA